MNCKKAQRLVDDLAKDRLPAALAEQVRQHLTDCTDCRVIQQRTARLVRLLSLKRFEQPSPAYFAGFLAEFHQRQETEAGKWGALWEKILGSLTVEPARVWRFGFAGSLGVILAAGVMWIGLRQQNPSSDLTAHQADAITRPAIVAEESGTIADSDAERVRLRLPISAQPVAAGLAFLTSEDRAESAEPGYVLDRIRVTPASYEVASVRF